MARDCGLAGDRGELGMEQAHRGGPACCYAQMAGGVPELLLPCAICGLQGAAAWRMGLYDSLLISNLNEKYTGIGKCRIFSYVLKPYATCVYVVLATFLKPYLGIWVCFWWICLQFFLSHEAGCSKSLPRTVTGPSIKVHLTGFY